MKYSIIKTFLFALSLSFLSCHTGRGRAFIATHHSSYAEATIEATTENDIESTSENTITDIDSGKKIEIPNGRAGVSSIILCREGYTVSYNKDTRTPNWVAWHLTADHTDGPVQRKGITFQPDQEVPSPQVDTHDYTRSGYDRGHMCPAGDNRWSVKAMEQSFLMTNICPQDHSLNSGLWNRIEEQCRSWAQAYGDVYIVCGPIYFNQKHVSIGTHKVQVPETFFKVVLCLRGIPKAIGFICRNVSGKGHKKIEYVNSIDEVERITGIDFFPQLPDRIETQVEKRANPSEWSMTN